MRTRIEESEINYCENKIVDFVYLAVYLCEFNLDEQIQCTLTSLS